MFMKNALDREPKMSRKEQKQREFKIGTSFWIPDNEYVVVNKQIDRITFKHYYSTKNWKLKESNKKT